MGSTELIRRRMMGEAKDPYDGILWNTELNTNSTTTSSSKFCVLPYLPIEVAGDYTLYFGAESDTSQISMMVDSNFAHRSAFRNRRTLTASSSHIGYYWRISMIQAEIDNCWVKDPNGSYVFKGRNVRGGISLLERRRAMMAKGEDLSTWVNVIFHLNNDAASQYIVDSNISRVPDAALSASRIIIDGTEITPQRYVAMSRGDHTVYYQIGDGGGHGWWYWIGNAISIEIPANVTSLNPNSIVFAASDTLTMTFHGEIPFTNRITSSYVLNRNIFVKEQYKQQYIDFGFTNITTF